jgi:hypothetical protein
MDILLPTISFTAAFLLSMLALTIYFSARVNAWESTSYTPPVPLPALEDSKMKQMTEIAKDYPGLKDWSTDEWEVRSTAYRGTIGGSVSYDYTIFYLHLSEKASAPYQCPHGWEAVIELNMHTMEPNPLYIPSPAEHTCPIPISSRTL